MRLVLAVAIAVFLAGCVPWPNYRLNAPQISGVVNADGIPVQKAEIRLSAASTAKMRHALTDADGRFMMDSLTTFRLLRGILGDPIYIFELRIVADGKEYLGYEGRHLGAKPGALDLVCDLARPVNWRGQIIYCSRKTIKK